MLCPRMGEWTIAGLVEHRGIRRDFSYLPLTSARRALFDALRWHNEAIRVCGTLYREAA